MTTHVSIPFKLKFDDCTYDLYSVVIHAGNSCNSGHYYTLSKDFDEKWLLLNDQRAKYVDDSFLSEIEKVSQFMIDENRYAISIVLSKRRTLNTTCRVFVKL